MFANTTLFDVDVFGPMNIWNALAIAITVEVVGAKRRVLQGAATIIFGVWLSAYIWMFVPGTYGKSTVCFWPKALVQIAGK